MGIMKDIRVRRLPVVDARGMLAGILSLNDLAVEARKQARGSGRGLKPDEVAETLSVVCEHRQPEFVAAKPVSRRAGELVAARI